MTVGLIASGHLRIVRIIEMDVPPAQDRKKRCLAEAGIKIPVNHAFASINLNTQSMEDVLYTVGYDANKQTLFI
jgi:O-methyltransferase involved in polyketide biosynthesis